MRLLIRPEQMNRIQQTAEEKFARRIVEHLRRDYAESVVTMPDNTAAKTAVADLSEEIVYRLVQNGIERARDQGFIYENSIAAFVALMFDVAPNFDKHNLSRVILSDQTVAPSERLDQLLEILTDKNWATIRDTYDADAWNPPPAKESNETVEINSEESM